jgi:hypothetical protein
MGGAIGGLIGTKLVPDLVKELSFSHKAFGTPRVGLEC